MMKTTVFPATESFSSLPREYHASHADEIWILRASEAVGAVIQPWSITPDCTRPTGSGFNPPSYMAKGRVSLARVARACRVASEAVFDSEKH